MDSILHDLPPMHQAFIICLFVLGGIFIYIFSRISTKRYKKSVSRLFSFRKSEDPSIDSIQKSLDVINQKYPTYLFIALDSATIEFRAKKLLLIDGSIGVESCDGFNNENLVFALDDTNNEDWFQTQRKVFESIIKFDNFSFYRVNMKKLQAELNQTQNQTTLHN